MTTTGDYSSNYSGYQVDRAVEKCLAALRTIEISGTSTERITVPFAAVLATPSSSADDNLISALDEKQDTLSSGTNIKTINNNSILGSGNLTIESGLPSQTGQSGKFLTTNGTSASWGNELPSQTGQSGKFLTTDGTSVSWETITIPEQDELIQNITTVSGTTITLVNNKGIYSKIISANTTFTFDVSGLGTLTNKAVTFELYLDMSSATYTLTFPNTVTWIEEPDFTSTGKYLLVFRSMDGGSSWIGNLKYMV